MYLKIDNILTLGRKNNQLHKEACATATLNMH